MADNSTDLMLRKLDLRLDNDHANAKSMDLKDSPTLHHTSDELSPSMEGILSYCLGSTKKKDVVPGA